MMMASDEVGKLKAENAQLREDKQRLLEKLALQGEQIPGLQARALALGDEVKTLQDANRKLVAENEALAKRVEALEKKDRIGGLREAMRVLEKYIVEELVGSKTKMRERKLYTLVNVETETKNDQALAERWRAFRRLTEAELTWVTYFKEEGDNLVHAAPAKDALLVSDGNPEEDTVKKKLLDTLSAYCSEAGRPFGKAFM